MFFPLSGLSPLASPLRAQALLKTAQTLPTLDAHAGQLPDEGRRPLGGVTGRGHDLSGGGGGRQSCQKEQVNLNTNASVLIRSMTSTSSGTGTACVFPCNLDFHATVHVCVLVCFCV